MIVKVQIPSLYTDGTYPPALVYNKDRSAEHHVPVTRPLLARMKGKPKAFFHMTGNELGDDAPDQDW